MCAALREAGVTPWLFDLSLRPHKHDVADVNGDAVAQASGTTWDALAKLSRADAAQTMIKGAAKLVSDKAASGTLAGIVGVGGANGSTMSCAVMRQLPLAFPKAMVTPVAATAAVQWYVAESDIAMFPTIGDISLNRITRAAIRNAAEAVAGMAKARARALPKRSKAADRRLVIRQSPAGGRPHHRAARGRGLRGHSLPRLRSRRPGAGIARLTRRACRRHRSHDLGADRLRHRRRLQRGRGAAARGRRRRHSANRRAGLRSISPIGGSARCRSVIAAAASFSTTSKFC